MSSTSDIAGKLAQLAAAGLDLGSPTAAEADAGFGGRVQVYQQGRIYWHPTIGTHEVHGAILAEYLRIGGPGLHPSWHTRTLGFPKSDEHSTLDGMARVSEFEWGAIHWGYGGGAVAIYGPFQNAWRAHLLPLGYPLTEAYPGPSGSQAVFCQYGALFLGGPNNDAHTLIYRGPRWGQPLLVSPASVSFLAFTPWGTLPAAVWQTISTHNPHYFTDLFTDRLFLQAVNDQRTRVPLRIELTDLQPFGTTTDVTFTLRASLAPGAVLEERTLYDVVVGRLDGTTAVMIPHCIYAKASWEQFGAFHATDLHVSERIDAYHARLVELGRAESAAAYNNYNEAVRDLITYANRLHRAGRLDLIIATGDLVDYQYESWQDPQRGWGNFHYLERVIRGAVGSPAARPVEELRVPIFTTVGNHDYRQRAYELVFKAGPGHVPFKEQENYQPRNLTKDDAVALQGGEPTISADSAFDMVRLIRIPEFYHQRMNPVGDGLGSFSYAVSLGPHRLVMLDTGYDVGVIQNSWEAFEVARIGIGNEDQKSFAAGAPNQRGIEDRHLELLERALQEAAGVVIVGMHAPPVNIKGAEFDDYFRETEHPTADVKDTVGYLIRQAPVNFIGAENAAGPVIVAPHLKRILSVDWDQAVSVARQVHPNWMAAIGKPYFARGSVEDLLDSDAAQARANDLLKMCTGVDVPGFTAARPVDVVLFGHGHVAVEYRLRWTGHELEFYMDFYTATPPVYYGCRRGSVDLGNTKLGVQVTPGAPFNPAPVNTVQDQRWEGEEWTLRVPPYAQPLSSADDPVQWWQAHRPLLMETGAIGPIETKANTRAAPGKTKPDPTFQGFRFLVVTPTAIARIHYVRLAELRARGFTMPFEDQHHDFDDIVDHQPPVLG